MGNRIDLLDGDAVQEYLETKCKKLGYVTSI